MFLCLFVCFFVSSHLNHHESHENNKAEHLALQNQTFSGLLRTFLGVLKGTAEMARFQCLRCELTAVCRVQQRPVASGRLAADVAATTAATGSPKPCYWKAMTQATPWSSQSSVVSWNCAAKTRELHRFVAYDEFISVFYMFIFVKLY